MKAKICVGDEVAFNFLKEATWFTVEKIDGFIFIVREAGTNYATQTIDRSLVVQVRKPAKETAQ